MFEGIELLEFVPIIIVGFLGGFISYNKETDREFSFKEAFFHILTAIFTTAIVFSLMDLTDWSYLAKMGISAGIGFLGIDKAFELAEKVMNIRRHR